MGCRAKAAQTSLIRLVWDGAAVVVARKRPGRGAWVHPDPECFRAAARPGLLARALRNPEAIELPPIPTDELKA